MKATMLESFHKVLSVTREICEEFWASLWLLLCLAIHKCLAMSELSSSRWVNESNGPFEASIVT